MSNSTGVLFHRGAPVDRHSFALLPLFINRVIFCLQHFLNSLPCLLNVFEGAFLFCLKHLNTVVEFLNVVFDTHAVVTSLFFREDARSSHISFSICIGS